MFIIILGLFALILVIFLIILFSGTSQNNHTIVNNYFFANKFKYDFYELKSLIEYKKLQIKSLVDKALISKDFISRMNYLSKAFNEASNILKLYSYRVDINNLIQFINQQRKIAIDNLNDEIENKILYFLSNYKEKALYKYLKQLKKDLKYYENKFVNFYENKRFDIQKCEYLLNGQNYNLYINEAIKEYFRKNFKNSLFNFHIAFFKISYLLNGRKNEALSKKLIKLNRIINKLKDKLSKKEFENSNNLKQAA